MDVSRTQEMVERLNRIQSDNSFEEKKSLEYS